MVGSSSTDRIPPGGTVVPSQNVIILIAYWKFADTDWQIKSVHIDDCSIVDTAQIAIPADLDGDEEEDYDAFESCASGPGVPDSAVVAAHSPVLRSSQRSVQSPD